MTGSPTVGAMKSSVNLNFVAFLSCCIIALAIGSMINTNEEIPGRGVILNPGFDLVLQCNTTDDPMLNVVWYKDGSPLNMSDARLSVDNNNNSLAVHKSAERDAGRYTCVVAAAAAAEQQQLVNATIVVRSKVKLQPFDSSRNVVQGQNIVLFCNVTQGTPQPTIQWFKDGLPMNLSQPRLSALSDARGLPDAKLTIAEAGSGDRAEYMCVATNELGPANATILVRVKDKYAALWPFLGICVEVAILCTIIFVYEKRRQKPEVDESEADHATENKTVSDQEDKGHDIRQRK